MKYFDCVIVVNFIRKRKERRSIKKKSSGIINPSIKGTYTIILDETGGEWWLRGGLRCPEATSYCKRSRAVPRSAAEQTRAAQEDRNTRRNARMAVRMPSVRTGRSKVSTCL